MAVTNELPIDAQIAALADRQHGVIALHQLQLLGLSKSAVSKRARVGRLHRIHRAVYAVGRSKLTGRGHWMAAVLACGPKAALSHRSAAGLWGLRQDNRRKSDISLPSPSARPKTAIEVHRSVTLAPEDLTVVDGIPCTTVARTLVDLGDLVNRRAVETAIGRAGPRRGTGILRSVLETSPARLSRQASSRKRFWRSSGTPEEMSCCGWRASSPSASPVGRWCSRTNG